MDKARPGLTFARRLRALSAASCCGFIELLLRGTTYGSENEQETPANPCSDPYPANTYEHQMVRCRSPATRLRNRSRTTKGIAGRSETGRKPYGAASTTSASNAEPSDSFVTFPSSSRHWVLSNPVKVDDPNARRTSESRWRRSLLRQQGGRGGSRGATGSSVQAQAGRHRGNRAKALSEDAPCHDSHWSAEARTAPTAKMRHGAYRQSRQILSPDPFPTHR